MDVSEIPFVKHLGIVEDENRVKMELHENIKNHLGTIHASAQFTLAETESGRYLLALFPDLEGKVLPLLRTSSVKYKHPATKDLWATASMESAVKDKFKEQFRKRGRATITVHVALHDSEGLLTMEGAFTWFIQGEIKL